MNESVPRQSLPSDDVITINDLGLTDERSYSHDSLSRSMRAVDGCTLVARSHPTKPSPGLGYPNPARRLR